MNDPRRFVDEMLEGILLAHPGELVSVAGDGRCIVRAAAAIGGGGGPGGGAARNVRFNFWTSIPFVK